MKHVFLALFCAGAVWAQPGMSWGDPFAHAVPRAEAASGEIELTLQDAIKQGLERNLGSVLASSAQRAARGEKIIALARLLPQLSATVNESSQQINLAAFGFPLPAGAPSVVGPFGLFDARAKLNQQILNLRLLYGNRASEQQVKAADLSAQDARDTVVMIVAALYWQSVAGASRIEAAQAQIATAQATLDQATEQKNAGLIPAIDVLRAQVELQAQRQRLISFENEFAKQKLRLAEAIGLPGNQPFHLANALQFRATTSLTPEGAAQRAYQARLDYQSQAARLRAAELRRKSAHALLLPSVNFEGDYGVLGQNPAQNHGTFTAKVGVNIPLFAGRGEHGAEEEAEAEVDRQKALLDQMRARIDFEIRAALLDMRSAAEQVEVNRSAVQLARDTETQARDRFAAGVTNNLEVVQAQQGLATANENYIASLYAYNVAQVSLARAMGGTEKNLAEWAQEGSK